ncbi:hypothetical protein COCON_G00199770 [Conger conger]|uniref:PH domain-containing protein n=1 Tax=Conger conger TaxID=82655 RepID=A0A9Q1HQP9_CONCO|nr:hypothetical protein COCON_G00199770 [Conger conger]
MEDVYRYTRSPVWEELEPEKGAPSTAGIGSAGIHQHVVGAVGGPGTADESSDSEGEQEGPQKLIRKVSTSGQIRSKTSIKEGLLLKQTSSFQRWKKRYFKLRGRTLYYAKDSKGGGVLSRWQERAYRVSRSRVCWRVLSVCWTGPRHAPQPLGTSGSEEGLVAVRVSSCGLDPFLRERRSSPGWPPCAFACPRRSPKALPSMPCSPPLLIRPRNEAEQSSGPLVMPLMTVPLPHSSKPMLPPIPHRPAQTRVPGQGGAGAIVFVPVDSVHLQNSNSHNPMRRGGGKRSVSLTSSLSPVHCPESCLQPRFIINIFSLS